MASIANFQPVEGSVTNTATLALDRRARFIEIINDDDTNPLKFKFNDGESYGTLKAKESITVPVHSAEVYLDGNGNAINYRIRSMS